MSPPAWVAFCCALSIVPTLASAQPTHAHDDARWTPEDFLVTAPREPRYGTDTASVTRSPTPLIEVPQSIQVLTRALLDDQQRTSLAEALANVSGVVSAQPSEAVLANPIVRGFEAEIFVDGLIAYGDTAVVDPASLAAVDRIEVAKGPTSLLFGGGTGAPVGGLINLVTKRPEPTRAASVALRGGSFNTVAGSGDLNLPVTPDLGFRLAGDYWRGDDFIDDVDVERTNVAPALRFELGADTRLDVSALYSSVRQLEYAGLPAAIAKAPGVDPFRFSGARDAPKTDIRNLMVTAVLSHRLSEAVTTSVQLRRYHSRFDELASFPFFAFFPPSGTLYPVIKGRLPAEVSEWTVDASATARFKTGAIAHTVLAGVQYDATDYDAALGFDFAPIGVIDYAQAGDTLAFGARPALTGFFQNEYRTLAGYVQDQMTVGQRLHILAGVRASVLGLEEVGGGAGSDEKTLRIDPRVGATVDVFPGLSLFAGFATGSRLSLFFTGSAPPVPETSRSAEAGLKLALTKLGLSGTISAFRSVRENVPTADPLVPFASIQTGAQRARGLEVDLLYEPTPAWSALAAIAYTDAEVTEDTRIPVGDRLSRVPAVQGRFALRYRVLQGPLNGLGLGFGITGSTAAALTLPNTTQSDPFVVFDAQARYAVGPVEVAVTVVNLADKRYFVPYQYLQQAVVRPGQPRSAFVTLTVRF